MFDSYGFEGLSEKDRYETMILSLRGLLSEDENVITKLSNATALINSLLTRVNWCGFYINNNGTLELGPFQGRVACTKIPFNKGVCGYCATTKETVLVEDVHKFPGHIACDSATNSEIVIPIIKEGHLYGLLDIDSEEFNRFGLLEKEALEKAVKEIENNIDWKKVREIYISNK